MLRLSLALLPLLTALARAEETRSLADLLPPETPAYFLAQAPTPEEEKAQAYWKVLEEPALKRLLERVSGEENSFTSAAIPLADEASLTVQTDMREQPVAVKFRYVDGQGERRFRIQRRFALAWVGMQDAKFPVDLVGAFDVDTAAGDVVGTLRRIVAAAVLMLREDAGGGIDGMVDELFTEASHRDVAYTVMTVEDFQLFLVPLGSMVIVATSEARVHDMIERFADGGNRPSLATDPRHRAIHDAAIGAGTVTMRMEVHADRALDALQAKFPGPMLMARNYMQMVGLGGMKGFSAVSRVDGAGVSSTVSLLIEGEKKGLGKLFAGREGGGSFGALEFAPKETLYVTCGGFDPGGFYQIGTEVLGGMVGMVGLQFQERFGLNLKEDLLDLVGPEAALIVAPTRGLLPDVGLVLESKDPERLERSLLALLRRAPWPAGTGIQSVRMAGTTLHVMPLAHPDLGAVPLAPCFGVVDGHVLVAPYPLTFQRFAAVKRGERESLAQNRDFARLRERVPENAVGISYMDLPKVLAFAYDTMMPILQSLPETAPGQRAPLYELPDMDSITRHLYGRIGWTVVDARGKHWCSHGAVDMTGVVLGFVGAATGVTTYFLGASQSPVEGHEHPVPVQTQADDPVARECLANVRFIRGHLHVYRKSREAFPASLDDLRHVPEARRKVPGADGEYVYLGMDAAGPVLLHGKPNGRDGRITILTKRLKIRRVSAEDLERLLRGPAEEDR